MRLANSPGVQSECISQMILLAAWTNTIDFTTGYDCWLGSGPVKKEDYISQ